MNRIYFLFFLIIFSFVYFILNYYVYSRIVNGLFLSQVTARYIKAFFYIGALSFFLGEFLSRKIVIHPIVYFGSIYLGVLSIAFSVFIVKDIVQIFFPSASKNLTTGALGLIFLFSVISIYNVATNLRIRELKVPVSKLPEKYKNFSIVQISDIHLGPITTVNWLKNIVKKVNKLNPDIIVITGDLVDIDLCKYERFNGILKELKSRSGVFAITGNHEYYSGIDNFVRILNHLNITLLRNSNIKIHDAIVLVGVDDDAGKQFSEAGYDLDSALKNADFTKPVVLLSHRPIRFKEAVDKGIDLQLSGHIHAGQIPPIDFLSWLVFEYPFGLHKYKFSSIYTTTGTGTWGPPMRLFSLSEIVKITLINKN